VVQVVIPVAAVADRPTQAEEAVAVAVVAAVVEAAAVVEVPQAVADLVAGNQ
jgi:hypothetical protein